MPVETPDWVADAVFYQIFPDRFSRSPRSPQLPGIQFAPWGAPPANQGFQGGDLYGIADRLDYLSDLGVNALYLNPIFAAAANHRYHTFEYRQVDPLLGGDAALRTLLDEAHSRGIRVVLDGVFNHASRGFWAFHHILETGGNSPYLDWFHVEDWPLRPYSSDGTNPPNYAAWWGLPALPKFNTANPGVRTYLLDVARHWIEFGADGWRLDVPAEIDDPDFWRDFRRVVKGANPDAYITGEIWEEAESWLQGDMFDSVMNYPLSRAILGFAAPRTLETSYEPGGYALRTLNGRAFAAELKRLLSLYDWQISLAQLNLLGSHDTARIRWMVGNDAAAVRLATLLQMTLPGAPCIYYGDEIGMTGGHDPECRGAFPWSQPESWDQNLLATVQALITLRHAHPALRRGGVEILHADAAVVAFCRRLHDESLIVLVNAASRKTTVDLTLTETAGNRGHFDAIWGQGRYQATDQGVLPAVSIPARSGVVLSRRPA